LVTSGVMVATELEGGLMTNRAILACCLVTAAIVAACGGGTAPTTSSVAPPSATPSTEPVASAAASPAGSAAAGLIAEDLAVAKIDGVPTPCEVAEGLKRVWISSYAENEVVGIDPATNEVVTTLAVPEGPCGVTVGFDSVWVSGGSQTVARIDPESGETLATIAIPGEIYDVQAGPDAVWATDRTNGTLVRIDPATNEIAATSELGTSGTGSGSQMTRSGSRPTGVARSSGSTRRTARSSPRSWWAHARTGLPLARTPSGSRTRATRR
jgi:YVTN family beta-propeller protein